MDLLELANDKVALKNGEGTSAYLTVNLNTIILLQGVAPQVSCIHYSRIMSMSKRLLMKKEIIFRINANFCLKTHLQSAGEEV